MKYLILSLSSSVLFFSLCTSVKAQLTKEWEYSAQAGVAVTYWADSPQAYLITEENRPFQDIVGISAIGGTVLWRFSIQKDFVTFVQSDQHGVFYVATRGYSGEGVLYAIDSASGVLNWELPLGQLQYPTKETFIIEKDQITYFHQGYGPAGESSKVVSIVAKSGLKIWEFSLDDYGYGDDEFRLAKMNGKVIAYTHRCKFDLEKQPMPKRVLSCIFDDGSYVQTKALIVLTEDGVFLHQERFNNPGPSRTHILMYDIESRTVIAENSVPEPPAPAYSYEQFQVSKGFAFWTYSIRDNDSGKRIEHLMAFDENSGALVSEVQYLQEWFIPAQTLAYDGKLNVLSHDRSWDYDFLHEFNPLSSTPLTSMQPMLQLFDYITVYDAEICYVKADLGVKQMTCRDPIPNAFTLKYSFPEQFHSINRVSVNQILLAGSNGLAKYLE